MNILSLPAIGEFLAAHENHAGGARPVAVFDCDGTVIRGDVGEAMFYYQIEHFLFRQSPASLWHDYPDREGLEHLYQTLALLPAGERMRAPVFARFAECLLSWYVDQIAAGAVVKACTDIVRLFAGYSVAEIRSVAEASFAQSAVAPLAPQLLGKRKIVRSLRFLKETSDLVAELQKRRFEIWAVSGSNKWSVEPVFHRLGIDADHVLGIELEERDGICTDRAREPVPIRDGKIRALQHRTSAIPVLTASDSKNDIPLFLYSAGLKVRINSRGRDTADFFRSAGVAPDESWVLIETPTVLA